MTTQLQDLRLTKVALCGQGQNPEADILLFKSDDPKATEPPAHKEATSVADDIKKNLDEVTTERDALAAELEALKNTDPKDIAALLGLELAKSADEEDVLKGVSPEVRERLEKAEKAASEQAEAIAKMQAERRTETFIRKARDEYGDLAPAETLGQILDVIDSTDPEVAKSLDEILKAAAARTNADLFREVGSSAGETDDVAKARVRAEEIRKENPALSEHDALRRAMAENPDAVAKAFARPTK